MREAVDAALDQHFDEQDGQKIVPSSTNRLSTSWLRLAFAVFSVGILIPLPGLLTFDPYIGRFGFASELAAIGVVCIAIVLINVLYQHKSETVLAPQRHLRSTGRTPSWHNIVLAVVSVLTLVKVTFDILQLQFVYDDATSLDMLHFILLARLIALGIMAATVIVINKVFFTKRP